MFNPPDGLPALTSDYFEFFGVKRSLALDLEQLQKRFYELSRLLHPDRYTRKPPEEKQYSQDATALLNDAYRVLRDPLQRAEYVLRQAGLDIGEQGTKNVPPELLEEVFELNMALEEMRGGDSSARPQLEQARDRFLNMQTEIDSGLQSQFAAYDASPDSAVLSR